MSALRKAFRLGRRALAVAAMSSAFAGSPWAQTAGIVEFAIGDVMATGLDGRGRALRKGGEIQSGDRVFTNLGRAQIRFTDGGYVSLQPQTEFAVREYRFSGSADGSERGIFGLVKGAMRTVTGLIGRVNRTAYQIRTPTATIGIRGTGGIIRVLDSGETLLFGTSGEWFARNAQGAEISVPTGTGVRITTNPAAPPQRISDRGIADAPHIAAARPLPPAAPETFAAGEARDRDGAVAALKAAPNCAAGCEVAFAFIDTGAGTGASPATAMPPPALDGEGRMTSFGGTANMKALAGSQVDTGARDGVVAWGRWIGGATINGAPWNGFQTLAYVVGPPTPIADMKSTTATFTYALIGATAPTDGVNLGVVTGGKVIGTFGPSPSATIDLSLALAGNTYTISGGPLFVPVSGPYAPFGGVVGASGTGCGTSGCSASVNGHFMGAGASHAGFSYSLNNSATSEIVGAAAFKR